MTVSNSDQATCHCGAVQITIAHRPAFLHDCNCSLCVKSGAVWGYYSVADVAVSGATCSYQRADRDVAVVQIHFCGTCGSTTHWTLTERAMDGTGMKGQMGVNMRLFDSEVLAGVELRFPDGKAWPGYGDFTFRGEAVVLGARGLG